MHPLPGVGPDGLPVERRVRVAPNPRQADEHAFGPFILLGKGIHLKRIFDRFRKTCRQKDTQRQRVAQHHMDDGPGPGRRMRCDSFQVLQHMCVGLRGRAVCIGQEKHFFGNRPRVGNGIPEPDRTTQRFILLLELSRNRMVSDDQAVTRHRAERIVLQSFANIIKKSLFSPARRRAGVIPRTPRCDASCGCRRGT